MKSQSSSVVDLNNKNIHKTNTVRELGQVDIGTFLKDVREIPEHIWKMENQSKPNKFKEFHSTEHIIFKFVTALNDYTSYYSKPIWAKWKDRIMPLLQKAVEPYAYSEHHFPRVMLAKLKAESHINAHKDGKKAAVYPHKIHIPIITNPQVSFFVNPKTYHFKEGFAYEVNNQKVHYAENAGSTDRIHLIFEYWGK